MRLCRSSDPSTTAAPIFFITTMQSAFIYDCTSQYVCLRSPVDAPNNVAKNLKCAAKYGQAHSIGALFGGGTVANFLGGNSVSSLVNLGLSLSGQQPFSSPPNLTGIGMGLPVNDVLRFSGGQTNPLYGSASGTIRSTAIKSIFNAATESGAISSIAAEGGELAVQGGLTASEFASGVGIAKFGFDALTFAYSYAFGCPE